MAVLYILSTFVRFYVGLYKKIGLVNENEKRIEVVLCIDLWICGITHRVKHEMY